MINIDLYLNDGANWQAQAVLTYIRSRRETVLDNTWDSELSCYIGTLEVGRYENCREQGYVFTIGYKGNYRHYAVYEHRNSDDIIVLIANGISLNTPDVDFMWKDHGGSDASKYDYDKAFPYKSIIECGDYIMEDMKSFINNINK